MFGVKIYKNHSSHVNKFAASIIHVMQTKFYNESVGPKNKIFGIRNIYDASKIYLSLNFRRFLLSIKDLKNF